jgi:hypothetical protein
MVPIVRYKLIMFQSVLPHPLKSRGMPDTCFGRTLDKATCKADIKEAKQLLVCNHNSHISLFTELLLLTNKYNIA